MVDVDDLLAKLRVEAVFWRLRQCDDEDVAMPFHIEVFRRWNAVDCHCVWREICVQCLPVALFRDRIPLAELNARCNL